MYYYWAYGLTIASGIEFPELFPIAYTETVDVTLEYGVVPPKIEASTGYASDSISISPIEYLLHVQKVASYYVSDGKKIVIQSLEDADDTSIRLFCLSNAFAALLHQRGSIPLHCSAFIDQEQLVLIMGDSGAGKSTTLAAMVQAGYTPFSDDVCVPLWEKEQKRLNMVSSYPMMKYWGDTFKLINLGESDRKIRPEIDKYGVYFHDQFILDPMPVKMVIILEKDPVAEGVVVKKLTGVDLFQRLERNAYRGEYLGYSGLQKEHFKLFAGIANATKAFLIKRPGVGDSILGMQKTILELLSI